MTGGVLSCILLTVLTLITMYSAKRDIVSFYGWTAISGWVQVFLDLTIWNAWWLSPLIGAYSLFFTWLWWRGRRDKRRRIKALIGAKSKALRDALVRRMGDRSIPVPT